MRTSTKSTLWVSLLMVAALPMPGLAGAQAHSATPTTRQAEPATVEDAGPSDAAASTTPGTMGAADRPGMRDERNYLPESDEASSLMPGSATMAITSAGLLLLGLFARKRRPRSPEAQTSPSLTLVESPPMVTPTLAPFPATAAAWSRPLGRTEAIAPR